MVVTTRVLGGASVSNKDILRMCWRSTAFYPSALCVKFLTNMCWIACKYVLTKQLDVWNIYWGIT